MKLKTRRGKINKTSKAIFSKSEGPEEPLTKTRDKMRRHKLPGLERTPRC